MNKIPTCGGSLWKQRGPCPRGRGPRGRAARSASLTTNVQFLQMQGLFPSLKYNRIQNVTWIIHSYLTR